MVSQSLRTCRAHHMPPVREQAPPNVGKDAHPLFVFPMKLRSLHMISHSQYAEPASGSSGSEAIDLIVTGLLIEKHDAAIQPLGVALFHQHKSVLQLGSYAVPWSQPLVMGIQEVNSHFYARAGLRMNR